MCIYNKIIKNRKYVANKKNGGIIPAVFDKRVLAVAVGCGRCIECKKKKARDWTVRLSEEIRENKNGKFVTMTFSDESIKKLSEEIKGIEGYELDNEIATLATRRFLERWRKKYKKSVRHWLVTELGGNGTENVHMHGIIWTDETNEEIENIWKYGFVGVGQYVNEITINYIVKYISKADEKHKEYNSKILTSAGIGSGYMKREDWKKNKYKEGETKEVYITRQGIKLALPIYYRNKIYKEEEREKLWIEKLDKEERYVLGTKIDISKGEEEYNKAVIRARKESKKLGYGNDVKNYDLKKYENERRNYNLLKRIERAEEVRTPTRAVLPEYTEQTEQVPLIPYTNLKNIF